MSFGRGFWRLFIVLFICFYGLRGPTESLRFVAFSDINGSVGNTEYVPGVLASLQNFLAKSPDLVIGVGDYVAGEDISRRLPDSAFPRMWESFTEKILSPVLGAGVAFAPSPGNHDASGYSRLQREREAYVRYWGGKKPLLNYVSDRHYPYFYSYTAKSVFFISLDDVTPFTLNQAELQRAWIKEQLNSAEARSAKARIVYGHIPLYSVLDKNKHASGNRGKYYEILSLEQLNKNSDGLEAILIDGNVDLAIFAHSHSFYPGTAVHKKNGKTAKLRILSMPCLGPGARYLHKESNRSPNGYALIEVNLQDGRIAYEIFSHDDEVIPKGSLPEEIPQPDPQVKYLREDLASQL